MEHLITKYLSQSELWVSNLSFLILVKSVVESKTDCWQDHQENSSHYSFHAVADVFSLHESDGIRFLDWITVGRFWSEI